MSWCRDRAIPGVLSDFSRPLAHLYVGEHRGHRTPLLHIIDGYAYPTRDPDDIIIVVAGAAEPYHATVLPGFTESVPVTPAIASP